jgi:hypothetical protein
VETPAKNLHLSLKKFIHECGQVADDAVEHVARDGRRFVRAILRQKVRQRAGAKGLGALLLCSFFVTAMCQADESGVPVSIARFDHSGNDYTLVVHPVKTDPPAAEDPYIGTCDRFEIRGTYGLLRGARKNDAELSRPAHKEVMEFLQQAFISGQTFTLGSVGTGFVPVEAGKPCVVKSRALRLVKDDSGAHVLSYHDAPETPAS